MTPEKIRDKYKLRIIDILKGMGETLRKEGFLTEGPFESTDDEYGWELGVRRGHGGSADDLGVVIRIAESEVRGDDPGGVSFILDASTRGGKVIADVVPFNYTPGVWVPIDNEQEVEERFRIIEGPDLIGDVVRAIVKEFPTGPKDWRPGWRKGPEMGARRKMSREDVAIRYGRFINGAMVALAKKLRRYGLSVESPHTEHDPPNYQWAMAVFMPPHKVGSRLKDDDIDVVARISSELKGDILFVFDVSTVGGTVITAVDSEPASLNDPDEIRERIEWLGSNGASWASDTILKHIRGAIKMGPKEWSPRWPEE